MSISIAINEAAENLKEFSDLEFPEVNKLLDEAGKAGAAWSGSYLGYHSRVYYKELMPPPAGAHFSSEWGLYSKNDFLGMGSTGEWIEYESKQIIEHINQMAGNPSLERSISASQKAREAIEDVKSKILSILYAQDIASGDKFLQKLVAEIEEIKVPTEDDFQKASFPRGRIGTRDQRVEHVIYLPPHKIIECTVAGILVPFTAAKNLYKIAKRISEHLKNMEKKMNVEERIGTNVFIGHGRSPHWRDLKDFINERLSLPWDEFNRVPIAGVTNITRLAQMLDQACIAFLVMSAEDEQADGNLHARMNVIHEVGLFQGRLGFERAIVLLEDGCEEFTNIQGLGQIRYPKGNISAVFESIRQVLEREKII